ncbi:hypothetical protein DGMP_34820 [Desulfomarina profundi]|uniref:Response regulatory domain-containing protein n=1 Tax=Desulfomarina profundi TaxID=2772557 RepID=A0A8D5FQY8_9BACT|nr:hypothetical protein [Desulfomarina profundi]BCL62789.1 hypothetical protein DGMP_34820 [Desulfomarina profundi]
MKVLVLEDDDSQLDTYSDAAEDFGNENEIEIELVPVKSVESAVQRMNDNSFDGAIIDLNLDVEQPDEAEGNRVLTEIKETRRFPVIVVSGNLANLEEKHRESKSPLFKLYDRTIENETVFNDIFKVYQTGITEILGRRGEVEAQLSDIFWKYLANDFDVWLDKGSQKKSFLRYTLAHLVEALGHLTEDEKFYHEAEVYIKPPIQKYIATGDIVEKDDERFVVLSPACDIQPREINGEITFNADRIILGKLIQIDRDAFLENGIISEEDNAKTKKKKLEKIINGLNPKYPFLPGYKDLYPAVIDIQNLFSFSISEYKDDFKRLATISGVFIRDIQASLSAYYGRQGQPDLDKKELLKQYKKHL